MNFSWNDAQVIGMIIAFSTISFIFGVVTTVIFEKKEKENDSS